MEHATTYDTAKLKQAPGIVVHCERGHQLQSYVYCLHLLTQHLFIRLKRVWPIRVQRWSDFSLFFFAYLIAAESEIPLHKNTIVRLWVKCVQN